MIDTSSSVVGIVIDWFRSVLDVACGESGFLFELLPWFVYIIVMAGVVFGFIAIKSIIKGP